MLKLYKKVTPAEMSRIVDTCKRQTVQQGGPYEVYPDPKGEERYLIIINSLSPGGDSAERFPLGSFYCNYQGPGTLSLMEDPAHDGDPKRLEQLERVKRRIDSFLQDTEGERT